MNIETSFKSLTNKKVIGGRIDSLTSLRFFAALAVFLHHCAPYLRGSEYEIVRVIYSYFFNGLAGVTFFFILSGFIITYSFRKHKESGKYDYADFLFFRVARLYPTHWLTFSLYIIIFFYPGQIAATEPSVLLTNFSLLHAFVPDSVYYFSVNPVSWSISVEMLFYVSFCLFASVRWFIPAAIMVAIYSTYVTFLLHPPSGVPEHWLFYINPAFRLGEFILGSLICRAYFLLKESPSYLTCSILEIISLGLLVVTVWVATNIKVPMNIIYDILFIPSMALVIASFALNNGVISDILSNKLMVLLGDSSFSLYMIQAMTLREALILFPPNEINSVQSILCVIITLVISILASVILFKLFEMPVNKALRSWWGKSRLVLKREGRY